MASVSATLLWILSSSGMLCAQPLGIVITKDSNAQPDSTAKAFEYSLIISKGSVTAYTMTNGVQVERNRFQPQFTVSYPNLKEHSITDPSQLGSIENGIRAYKALIEKYPSSSPFLQPYIDTSDEIIRRVKSGEVLFNQEFMKKSDYQALILREESEANEFAAEGKKKRQQKAENAQRVDMETRRKKQ